MALSMKRGLNVIFDTTALAPRALRTTRESFETAWEVLTLFAADVGDISETRLEVISTMVSIAVSLAINSNDKE